MKAEAMSIEEKYKLVRNALVGVVDSDDPEELKQMLNTIQISGADHKQRCSAITAIQALIDTQESPAS